SILREARLHERKLEELVEEARRNYPDQGERLSRALIAYQKLRAREISAKPETTRGPRGFDPFVELRRFFAVYWRPLITLIALIPALLSVLRWIGVPVSVWPGRANRLTQSFVIGLGVVIVVVVRIPKIAYRVTRWLVPPPAPLSDRPRVFRGPVSYDVQDAARFHGREADGEACWERLRRKRFFI